MSEKQGHYLVGQDITACKCGKSDHTVISYFVKTTRFIQREIGYDCLVWVCEQCDWTTQFECDGPKENNYNFCPKCGRKITELVPYEDPLDEWVEEE